MAGWIVVQVPRTGHGEPDRPTRVVFYAKTHGDKRTDWTTDIEKAHRFESLKDAKRAANRHMHYAKNLDAVPVPFNIAWALQFAIRASWDKTSR